MSSNNKNDPVDSMIFSGVAACMIAAGVSPVCNNNGLSMFPTLGICTVAGFVVFFAVMFFLEN